MGRMGEGVLAPSLLRNAACYHASLGVWVLSWRASFPPEVSAGTACQGGLQRPDYIKAQQLTVLEREAP